MCVGVLHLQKSFRGEESCNVSSEIQQDINNFKISSLEICGRPRGGSRWGYVTLEKGRAGMCVRRLAIEVGEV